MDEEVVTLTCLQSSSLALHIRWMQQGSRGGTGRVQETLAASADTSDRHMPSCCCQS